MTQPALRNVARIPAGDFLMGAADAGEDERPVHRVFVSEFYIGRFAVTNDEYARFLRATNHPAPAVRRLPLVAGSGRDRLFRELAAPYVWPDKETPPPGRGGHPVSLVRYEDAVAFCRWLSDESRRLVRLPTEAAWEKAARGGIDGQRYPWGNEIDLSYANYLADPAQKHQRGTRPAGTYPPNPYGLCDVIGNVWEWVADWYNPDYYAMSEPNDPRGPN